MLKKLIGFVSSLLTLFAIYMAIRGWGDIAKSSRHAYLDIRSKRKNK